MKRAKKFEWVRQARWKFVKRATVVEWCERGHWALVMRAQTGE